MDKIAIITDSVACLPQELTEQYNIHIVPAGIIYFNGKTYRDWIDLGHKEAYQILESSPNDFFTGPPSPGDFLDLYRKLSKDHNALVYIALSSKLSTIYNVARIARDVARKELPDIRIEIIDSGTATAAEGFVALAAAKAVMAGKSLDEVMKTALDVKKRVDLFYVLYTIQYVHRTGRVPRQVADLGSKLNVKPIITIINGVALINGLVRNKAKGIESLVRIAKQKINGNPVHLAILHAEAAAEAEILKQQLESELNCVELWIGQFSPLMVYATGKGVLGIAFYTENSSGAKPG